MNDANIHAASNAAIAKAMATAASAQPVDKINRKAEAEAVINAKAREAASKPLATKSSHPAGVLKRPSAFWIDPTLIDVREGWNPRFDFGEIEELAAQIKYQHQFDGHGLLNDIRVKRKDGGRFELVDGNRRLLAIQLLMKKGVQFKDGIPAKIEHADAADKDLLTRMFIANEGKRFLPLEEAAAFKRMRDEGMTLKQIEKATGRSDNSIVSALALLDSDESLQDAVRTGKVTATLGRQIAVNARGNKEKQAELTKAALEAGKDTVKRRAVLKSVEAERRDKATKRGATLKIKMRAEHELSALGSGVAQTLAALLQEAGMALDTDLRAWIQADPELVIAATFGALEALKTAAGADIDVKFSA